VSPRSKLKSRTALIGEHPNPLYLVQHKDAMIQHRKNVNKKLIVLPLLLLLL